MHEMERESVVNDCAVNSIQTSVSWIKTEIIMNISSSPISLGHMWSFVAIDSSDIGKVPTKLHLSNYKPTSATTDVEQKNK